MDGIEEFKDAMRAHGLNPPEIIEPGKLHRFPTNGKRHDDAGWCKLFANGGGGVFGDFRSGRSETWQAKREKPFTSAEGEAFRQRCKAECRAREAEEACRHADAREKAAENLAAATENPATHPYAIKKQVPFGPLLKRGAWSARSDGRDPITAATLQDALNRACAEVGIVDRDVPADGQWHPTDIDGDPRGRGDGRIKLFPDGEGGIVCNWKGETRPFFVDDGRKLPKAERRDRQWRRAESIRLAQEEQARRHAKAARKASAIWNASPSATDDHSYLRRKQIQAHGARLYRGSLVVKGMPCDGSLIVPAGDGNGAIHTLQFISPDDKRDGDNKRFLPGGAAAGAYWAPQELSDGDGCGLTLLIGEGIATVLSAKEATGHFAIAALSSGNLLAVAKAMRKRYPAAALVVLADLLRDTGPDPHAGEAAGAVGGLVAIPDFGPDRPEWAKDFNDMVVLRGREAVGECIRRQVEDATVRRLAEAFADRIRPLAPARGRRAQRARFDPGRRGREGAARTGWRR
jgi:phage/plasmid primase-like uncharacterized protein